MLKGDNVYLAPLMADDMATMLKWINDREEVLFNASYKPVSESMHRAWFESVQNRSDLVIFGIRLGKTAELIGSCQLRHINPVHGTAELQIRIGKVDERGHGHGTEAVRLLLDFAFQDMNLQRVYLHVFATNPRALRVYEKIGFAREGLLRRAAYIDGQYVDVIVMGILKPEHLALRPGAKQVVPTSPRKKGGA
jgi:RimJ/RimL family protein N-acetyltransferase